MRTYQTIAKAAKGFTLVELIVVISVLAVLATIAFTSVSNVSMDARNSKRTTDLSTIRSKMAIQMSQGTTLASVVNGTTSSFAADTLTGGGTPNRTFGGWRILADVAITNYAAGDVNYAVLGMKGADFADPDNTSKFYKMGKMDAAGGVYELASVKEASTGKTGLVSGTYLPRNGANGSTGVVVNNAAANATFKLTNISDIGKWSTNDQVSFANGATVTGVGWKIKSVDNDGTIALYSSAAVL